MKSIFAKDPRSLVMLRFLVFGCYPILLLADVFGRNSASVEIASFAYWGLAALLLPLLILAEIVGLLISWKKSELVAYFGDFRGHAISLSVVGSIVLFCLITSII